MTLPSRPVLFFHLIGWLFFLSLPLIFIAGQTQQDFNLFYMLPLYWLYFSIYPVIFYLHTFYLFPTFYIGRNYLFYILTLVLMGAAVYFLRPFDRTLKLTQSTRQEQNFSPGANRPFPPPAENGFPGGPPPGEPPMMQQTPPGNFPQPAQGQGPMNRNGRQGAPMLDIVSILFFVLTIGLSITLVSIRRWRLATRLAAQAETDKVNAELSFLKAQINPHFLFNTLNNIYSMAVMKDDNTADSILELSNIMRYVTDEVDGDFVSLQSEADCITDYIDLQKLRLSKKAEIDYQTNGRLDTKIIAPLILITFVENVFKYGISSHEYSPVTIHLTATENSISFHCRNKIFPANEISDRTGIGIANIKKRLAFLYPNRHLLNMDTADGIFTVNLTLQT